MPPDLEDFHHFSWQHRSSTTDATATTAGLQKRAHFELPLGHDTASGMERSCIFLLQVLLGTLFGEGVDAGPLRTDITGLRPAWRGQTTAGKHRMPPDLEDFHHFSWQHRSSTTDATATTAGLQKRAHFELPLGHDTASGMERSCIFLLQ
ncbi:hypothetical protein HPB47_014039, partial [Ixodes persulcatus]